jgi:hypothetical protein
MPQLADIRDKPMVAQTIAEVPRIANGLYAES